MQDPWGGGGCGEQRGYLLHGGAMDVEGPACRAGVLDGDTARRGRNDGSDGPDDQGIASTAAGAQQIRRPRGVDSLGKIRSGGGGGGHEDSPK